MTQHDDEFLLITFTPEELGGEETEVEYHITPKPSEEEVFDFLNQLQRSQNVNMLGAAPIIEKQFAALNDVDARLHLDNWMVDKRATHTNTINLADIVAHIKANPEKYS